MRAKWGGALAALAVLGSSVVAQAEPGRYGGGFIEFLMTADGSSPARRASVDGYGALGEPRPLAVPQPRARFAALPTRPAPEEGMIARTVDPRFSRQVVAYDGLGRAGQIVIDTNAKYLYLIQPEGRAIRYGIGVGRPGFVWTGAKTISAKREWPDWTPPAEMLRRRPDLPRHMVGGPENPLGARAMYLGTSLYRIHGTNEPHTIGQNVSSGCIRMMNEDVIDLYERTPVGTRVEVI